MTLFFERASLRREAESVSPGILPGYVLSGRTPLQHQRMLLGALPGPKELHVIKDALHTFRDHAHLAEIKEIFKQWIQKLS